MNTIKITIATSEDARSIRQVQHDVWIATYPNEEFGITLEAIKKRVSKNLSPESVSNLE